MGVPGLAEYRDTGSGRVSGQSRTGRVSGLREWLSIGTVREWPSIGTKRDLLQNSYRDALRDSHRRSYLDTQPRRDTEGLVAGLAAGLGLGRAAKLVPGRAAGLLLKLVPGRAAGLALGLVLGLEAVSKGNSRVKIEQRRRVQHLENFRIFRVPVRPKRRDSVSINFFLYFFCFFVHTPQTIYN